MTVCKMMLRQKEVERTQCQFELSKAKVLCAASERTLAIADRTREQAQANLWITMTADILCVQRLLLARGSADATKIEFERAREIHAQHEAEAQRLLRALVRIEKQIEKLLDRVALEEQALEQERGKRAMRELDDWVLGMRGAVR